MKKLFNREKGFTIIEVVLVLAIAGLIFLVVFLALPQLQASRRDTQRKSDAGRLVAALENWAGNHGGNYPTQAELSSSTGPAWTTANIAGDYNDPSTGVTYLFADAWSASMTQTVGGVVVESGIIDYGTSVSCNTTADGYVTGQARDIAIVMQLENGQYCQDNR